MKIGMVVPGLGFAGGIERHAWDLARSLSQRGHQIRLIHGPNSGRDPEQYASAFERAVSIGDARSADGLDIVYVHKADDVRELENFRGVPMVIVTHDHALTCVRSHRYLPIGLTPCHRAPGIACVTNGCVVVRNREPGARLPVRLASPFALRDRLLALARRAPMVACSEYVRRNVIAAGVAPSRIRVVHPIPPEDAAPTRPRTETRRLVVAGQLLRGKGVDVAIDAMRHLPNDVALDIVGDGPSRHALEAQARNLGERVRFLGYVPPDQLRDRYDAASVILVPSRWPEPFGMTGIEAMRRARPVVGARHGGIPEWLPEGTAGYLFEPASAEDLARATRLALSDVDAGERAHAWVARAFPHRRLVDEVEALLRDVLSSEARS